MIKPMTSKNRADRTEGRGDGEARPSLAGPSPTIARWASGYGWVVFGIDGLDRPFVQALDEGGFVWQGQGPYGTLDEALRDLEEWLARFMAKQGFDREPSASPKTPVRSGKQPRRSEDVSRKSHHRPEGHP